MLSFGSFGFPLSSSTSLKALSTSGYNFDKLEFSFSGVLEVSSAVLIHWLLIIAFLQESVCTLLVFDLSLSLYININIYI